MPIGFVYIFPKESSVEELIVEIGNCIFRKVSQVCVRIRVEIAFFCVSVSVRSVLRWVCVCVAAFSLCRWRCDRVATRFVTRSLIGRDSAAPR